MRELSLSHMEGAPYIQAFGFGTRATGYLRSSIRPPAIRGLGNESEFNALAHGIDAVSADTDDLSLPSRLLGALRGHIAWSLGPRLDALLFFRSGSGLDGRLFHPLVIGFPRRVVVFFAFRSIRVSADLELVDRVDLPQRAAKGGPISLWSCGDFD